MQLDMGLSPEVSGDSSLAQCERNVSATFFSAASANLCARIGMFEASMFDLVTVDAGLL